MRRRGKTGDAMEARGGVGGGGWSRTGGAMEARGEVGGGGNVCL